MTDDEVFSAKLGLCVQDGPSQYNLRLARTDRRVFVHTVTRSLILPYSTAEMYFLVDDVDRYHEFLPWCKSSVVLKRERTAVTARIVVSFKGLSTAFTTRNCLISDQEITMELVEGPFDDLTGGWRFSSLDEKACRVSLEVRFSLAGRLANQTITPVFKHICTTLVESFAERAKELYGERQFA
jgi:ribosome-associated toxin RatA of RatAB toxin-antitoxin module